MATDLSLFRAGRSIVPPSELKACSSPSSDDFRV